MADTKISGLTGVASVAGTNEFAVNEAGTSKKATASQIQTFVINGPGTTTTVLHGNAAGSPSFGAVTSADVDSSIVTPSSVSTFTNKTLDVEGTGNALTTVHFLEWAMLCQFGTASHPFDSAATAVPEAACISGSNTIRGVLDFDATVNETVQGNFLLPSDWTGNIDASIRWQAAAITGDVVWGLQTACVADGETGDPAFNAAQTVTDTAKGTTNQFNDAAITTVTTTGCAAGETLFFQFYRDAVNAADTMSGDARLISLRFKLRRTQ